MALLTATACTSAAPAGTPDGDVAAGPPRAFDADAYRVPALRSPQVSGLAACDPADLGAPPETTLPVGLRLTCGRVEVLPADGADSVSWPVYLLGRNPQAVRPEERYTFFLPGGPGISAGRSLVASVPDVDFDSTTLVAWEGSTAEVRAGACGPRDVSLGTQDSSPAAVAEAADECAEVPRRLPWAGSAGTAAAEMDAIRRALGAETVDVLSFSYGAAIAQAFVDRYPRSVERAVLDSPVLLDVPWDARVAAVEWAARSAWDQFVARCRRTSCVKPGHPVLSAGGYAEVRAQVLAARPRIGGGSQRLTARVLDRASHAALGSWDLFRLYAAGVERALGGDAHDLYVLGTTSFFNVDRAVFLEAACVDLGVTLDGAAGGDETASPLARGFALDLAPCHALRIPGVDRPLSRPAPADVLVLASEADVLAPAAAVRRSRWASTARRCFREDPGHGLAFDADLSVTVRDFLSRQLDDPDCGSRRS